MKNRFRTCSLFSLLLISSFFLSMFAPMQVQASVAQPESDYFHTVRVAVVDTPYLSEKQNDGSFEGILIDYLHELAKYAGWRLEYVEGTAGDLIWQLADGKVDLMGGVFKNAATVDLYDFPAYSSGSSYGVLLAKKSRQAYLPMDYSSFNGIRVGIYNKALSRITDFDDFCRANGLSFEKEFFNDSEVLLQALETGEVDAILSNDNSCRSDEQILARVGETPLYFAVTKGNGTILRELNTALATLRQVSPQFDKTMYQRHILSQQQTAILTAEERSFAQQQEPLVVAVVPGLAPAEDWDEKTDAAVGIAPDILALVAQRTGLRFSFQLVPTLTEARKMLRTGEADLTLRPCGASTVEPDGVQTTSYLESQMIQVYNLAPQESANGVAAILEGYHDQTETKRMVQVFDTLGQCVQAVVDGKAEYMTLSAMLLENYPNLKANKRLLLVPVPNKVESASFLLRESTHPMLISIFDKALQSLNTDEVQQLIYRHTVTQFPVPSFLTLHQIYPTEFAWGVAGFFFITAAAAVLLLLFSRMRLKLSRESSLQEESYRIVGALSGEQVFLYDFGKRRLTLPKPFADVLGIDKVQHMRSNREIPEPVEKLLELFSASHIDAQPNTPLEICCKLADGTEGWFRAVGTVLPGPDGTPLRGIGGLRSIQKEVFHLQQLEKQANTDYLTGLSNRQSSEQLIRKSFSEYGSGALFIIDIDYFKQINDLMGHAAGDLVLQEFAKLLQQNFSTEDVVGRWGGDEFIAFVRGETDKATISNRVHHLCTEMDRDFVYDGKTAALSISVGIAVAEDKIPYQEFFLRADEALYRVKSTTRNGFYLA